MYSLFNKYQNTIYFLLVSLFILFIQVNLPSIVIFKANEINLDLFLVYLTFLIYLKEETYQVILLAFLYGLIQDIVINADQIGLLSFIKSVAIYFLAYVLKYKTIWKKSIKMLYIFSIYFVHFFIYYIIIYHEIYIAVILVGLFQALLCITIFYVINRLLFKID